MTSRLLERVGAQRPTSVLLPADRVSSAGQEAIRLAESAGLVLDDWQRWVLTEALYERGDGRWSAFEAAVICPRQNGKNAVLEALELAALFLFDVRLIIHSAHEVPTALEHFLRLTTLIEGTPDLRRKVANIYTANGQEAIVLRSGARLKVKARSKGGGRGFTSDLLVLDEAYDLPAKALGAMMPTLAARPNTQIWYTSSPAHVDSLVLHGVRRRGIAGSGDRLFFAEWSNDPDVATDDRDAWHRANPGLGIRIELETMEGLYESMRHAALAEFRREHLGIAEVPLSEDDLRALPAGEWVACADPASTAVSGLTFGVDVAPTLRSAAVGVAGLRADELEHWEVIRHADGTGWVVDALVKLTGEHGGSVAVDMTGAGKSLVPDMDAAGLKVVKLGAGDVAGACGRFASAVRDGVGRHLGQASLDGAVRGAVSRPVSDAWRFDRRAQGVDLSPLYSVVLASWALATVEPEPEFFVY